MVTRQHRDGPTQVHHRGTHQVRVRSPRRGPGLAALSSACGPAVFKTRRRFSPCSVPSEVEADDDVKLIARVPPGDRTRSWPCRFCVSVLLVARPVELAGRTQERDVELLLGPALEGLFAPRAQAGSGCRHLARRSLAALHRFPGSISSCTCARPGSGATRRAMRPCTLSVRPRSVSGA
ncbi:MAG: hypothetical protein QOG87_3796 [Actinomycetota bacterium]|jgi:hypothetical protein